MTYRFNLF